MKRIIVTLSFIACAALAFSQNVLFIVGNTTLSTADQNIYNRLDINYTVTTVDAASSATGDATGKQLIFISSTVSSTDIGSKFTSVAVPLINCEQAAFDDLKMTANTAADHGTQFTVRLLTIHMPSHPLAASLSGTDTVHTSNHNFSWGLPNSNGVKVATVVGDTNKVVIFAYESGATMVGATAPARRVGFYFSDNSAQLWNNKGQALFDAAVAWATGGGGSNTPPTVSITAPEDSASYSAPADITITATASDSDGSISDVEFFYGATSIGTDNSSPFSILWEDVEAGSYQITALATDDDGDTTRSSVVNVFVSVGGSLPGGEEGQTLRHDGDTWVADSNLYNDGSHIGIGTTSPRGELDVNGMVIIGEEMYSDSVLTYGNDLMLSVDGGIAAKEVLVSMTDWADYVFDENYELPSLDAVDAFIEQNNHLPGVPSTQEVQQHGINLGAINVTLLRKIEELTLYILEQNKRITSLEKKIAQQ